MRYRIFDARRGLLTADKEIEAESPIEAVRTPYKNVRRVTERDTRRGFSGDIVVNNRYVYDGTFRNDSGQKIKMTDEEEIVVFNDKSWVRLSSFQKLEAKLEAQAAQIDGMKEKITDLIYNDADCLDKIIELLDGWETDE